MSERSDRIEGRVHEILQEMHNAGPAAIVRAISVAVDEELASLVYLTSPPVLSQCTTCKGERHVECCGNHMCPGTRTCHTCNGKGVCLSPEDKARAEAIKTLLEHR